jgi:UPF0755 protein
MSQLGLTMAGESTSGRGTNRKRRRTQRKQRRRGSMSVLLAIVILVGLVGGAGYVGMQKGRTWLSERFGSGPDYAGQGVGEVVVEVKAGQSARQIGRTLEAHGVVRSARAFTTAASNDPKSQGIQPGFYRLHKQMKASVALALMLSPGSRVGTLSIPEGWRTTKIIAAVAQSGGIPLAQLQSAVRSPAKLGLPGYAKGTVEGFLFPARYDVNRKMTASQALSQLVTRFASETAGLNLEATAQAKGISPYQALIVASLVQAEARHPEDFGKVARVIYNRLNSKLEVERRLQFDSTINYARNTSRLDLTSKEIQSFDSPYNSYTRAGLPPTPIGNPGKAALAAALNPTPGNWRYFVTVNPRTGETRFTDSYQQFLRWKAEFKKNSGG